MRILTLTVIAGICFATTGCQAKSEHANSVSTEAETNTPAMAEYVRSGQALPLTTITDIDGNIVNLASHDKKKLVILFATWCSDSNRALKALNQSELLNDSEIEIIAIAREETNETVKKWRDENGINVPLATDPDRSIYKQFASGGIPRMITVDKHNNIIKMNLAEGENQLALIEWQDNEK